MGLARSLPRSLRELAEELTMQLSTFYYQSWLVMDVPDDWRWHCDTHAQAGLQGTAGLSAFALGLARFWSRSSRGGSQGPERDAEGSGPASMGVGKTDPAWATWYPLISGRPTSRLRKTFVHGVPLDLSKAFDFCLFKTVQSWKSHQPRPWEGTLFAGLRTVGTGPHSVVVNGVTSRWCPMGSVLFKICPADVARGMEYTLSHRFLTTLRWVRLSVCWKLGRLFGRMWTGLINGARPAGWGSGRPSTGSCPRVLTIPCISPGCGQSCWKAAQRKRWTGRGWTWTSMCFGGQEGQCLPGLYQRRFYDFPLVTSSIRSFRIKFWKSYIESEGHLTSFHADKWSDTSMNL